MSYLFLFTGTEWQVLVIVNKAALYWYQALSNATNRCYLPTYFPNPELRLSIEANQFMFNSQTILKSQSMTWIDKFFHYMDSFSPTFFHHYMDHISLFSRSIFWSPCQPTPSFPTPESYSFSGTQLAQVSLSSLSRNLKL